MPCYHESCPQPITRACTHSHTCGNSGCPTHIQRFRVAGNIVTLCAECNLLYEVFGRLATPESTPIPENLLLLYAHLLEDGQTEQAQTLIESNQELAAAIWPFHVLIARLGYEAYPFPQALVRSRSWPLASQSRQELLPTTPTLAIRRTALAALVRWQARAPPPALAICRKQSRCPPAH
jgi:hypothetical protein